MTTIRAGDREFHTLPTGHVLTATAAAASAGLVRQYPASGFDAVSATAIGAGGTATIGPFTGSVRLGVECSAGTVTWTAGEPDASRDLAAAEVAATQALVSGGGITLNTSSAAAGNVSVIQAALTAGGLVTLVGTGEAFTNAKLVIGDNTTLDCRSLSLRLSPTIQQSMLVNSAHLLPWTNITGSFTAVGLVGTVNHTAHGFSAGDYVWLQGATQAGYNGVLEVLTATVNQMTVRLPFAPTVLTATGTVQIKRPNRNITILGLSLDVDEAQRGLPTSPEAHCAILNGVQGLIVQRYSAERCLKYGLCIGAVTDAHLKTLTFNNDRGGADGLHLNGPAHRLLAEGIFGKTGDDFVSLTVGDYANWEVSRGDFADVTIRGMFCTYSDASIAKYAGNAPYRAENLEFDGVYGTARLSGVIIYDDTVGGSLLGTSGGEIRVKNVAMASTTAAAGVEIQIGGRIDAILIDGVDCSKLKGGPGVRANKAQATDNGAIGLLRCRRIVNAKTPTTAITGVAIGGIAPTGAGTAFAIDTLDVDVDMIVTTGHGLALQTNALTTTIKDLIFAGTVRGPGGGAQTCCAFLHDSGLVQSINISRLNAEGVQQVYRQNEPDKGTVYISMSNVQATGLIRLLEMRCSGTIDLGGGINLRNPSNATNAPIRVVGSSRAAVVRINGEITAVGSTSVDLDVVGTEGGQTFDPTVSVRGMLRCDANKVRGATANDELWNTNASWASGSGTSKIGRYGYTGSAWTKMFGLA